MEEFKQVHNLKFDNNYLNVLIDNLNEIFEKRQNDFSALCVGVSKIYYFCKENTYKAKDNEYYDAYKLLKKFGFEKRTILRLVKCYEKFMQGCDNVDTKIKSAFFLFSPSKLYLLTELSDTQLKTDIENNFLTPDMTVKEIKEYIKKIKGSENEENKVLEEPDVNSDEDDPNDELFYDINKHYELDFFESCSKEQLLSIVMTLQLEFEKLKSKGKKK